MAKGSADRGVAVAMGGYVGYLIAVSTVFAVLGYRLFGPVGGLVAAPAAVAVGFAAVGRVHRVRAKEELERRMLSEALGVAFLVTMLGVVTHGLLETFAQAPRLSMR